MRKFIIILISALIVQSSFAIEKTKVSGNTPQTADNPQKVNGDSVVKPKVPAAKEAPRATEPAKKTYDDFIDKDGDGIDDRIEAKKVKPPEKPKVKAPERPKPTPPRK